MQRKIIASALLFLLAALPGCVSGIDRIGGAVTCEDYGDSDEICSLDYPRNRVFGSGNYISGKYIFIVKDFSHEVSGVGSILKARDTFGIKYVGNIISCSPTLNVIENPVYTSFSDIELDDLSKPFIMTPQEFVGFESIKKLGPRFRDVVSIRVRFGDIKRSDISELKLESLIYNNFNSLPIVCRSWLTEDTHIVTSTLSVDDIEYIFQGRFGKNQIITDENLAEFVVFDSDVEYGITLRGTIAVRSEHDVAIGDSIAIETFDSEAEPLKNVLSRHYQYVKRY